MSTTINVTVGGDGLLDQSRQQMQANRFGRLERDQDRKTGDQAAEQQQKRQERTEPTGRLAQSRRSDPEPAANRQTGLAFLTSQGLNMKTRGCLNTFVRPVSDYTNSDLTGLDFTPDIEASTGPGGAPSFKPRHQSYENTTSSITGYIQEFCVGFAACDSPSFTRIRTDDYIRVLTKEGWVPPAIQGRKKTSRSFTLEGFIKPMAPVVDSTRFNAVKLSLDVPMPGTASKYVSFSLTSNVTMAAVSAPYLSASISDSSGTDPGYSYVLQDSDQPGPGEGEWCHFAFVYGPSLASFYWRGERLIHGSCRGGFKYTTDPPNQFNAYLEIRGISSGNFPDVAETSLSLMGPVRFTQKRLYHDSFTPPSSLTSFG